MSAVVEMESAARRLMAATLRLDDVVAQLLAASRQLVAGAPAKAASARTQPLHGCCKRAAHLATYYTSRPVIARRSTRRWTMPQA